MRKEINYKDFLLENTVYVNNLDTTDAQDFKWLSRQIDDGKRNLMTNSVEFIVAKVLNKEKKLTNWRSKSSFDVYVVGTFNKSFIPVEKVAKAFADFYLEMGVLPNIIPISSNILVKDRSVLSKIKNCLLLYERR